MTLYIMQGIPGSGKSTIARMIQDQTGAFICSTDDLWYDCNGTYIFDVTKLAEKHKANQCHVRGFLELGCDVIVDNTNIKKSEAKPYLDMAKEFGADVQIIRVQADLETCIKRNAARSEDRRVPEDVIRRKHFEMEHLV